MFNVHRNTVKEGLAREKRERWIKESWVAPALALHVRGDEIRKWLRPNRGGL